MPRALSLKKRAAPAARHAGVQRRIVRINDLAGQITNLSADVLGELGCKPNLGLIHARDMCDRISDLWEQATAVVNELTKAKHWRAKEASPEFNPEF